MSSVASSWQRVNRDHPCPICGHTRWCLYAGPDHQPTAVICPRTPSDKECGGAGWLHRLSEGGQRPQRSVIRIGGSLSSNDVDYGGLASYFRRTCNPNHLDRFAAKLGVTVNSLIRLSVGWSEGHDAWTFPMRNAAGKVVGIRLRRPDGRKLSVPGGHEGLFVPTNQSPSDRLLVCEGPTDTAALLDLKFMAIGRPSCTGGVRHIVDLVRQLQAGEVVVVADSDQPGRHGAASLAGTLVRYCRVRIITAPKPFKDARDWLRAGARWVDVQRAINKAQVRKLTITITRKEVANEHEPQRRVEGGMEIQRHQRHGDGHGT